ncbi:hypothetical protein RBI22_15305 [Alcaligenaceae bacterium C4P045]|nr:hypothetical protein [Alcaligenaceae bacterium C4P045]
MAALPAFHLRADLLQDPDNRQTLAPRLAPVLPAGDDFYRTGAPHLVDAPTVTEEQAVRQVLAVLTGEGATAFGGSREYWCEFINDLVAADQSSAFVVLLAPTTIPSLPRHVRTDLSRSIATRANELLAELLPE